MPTMGASATRANDPAPLVSVVIPCYKQAHYLGDAIESALRQTHACIEVIVVNDGSPDNTAAVAAQYGVRYIEQPNCGVAAARNAGLHDSRGEFVVFLDADDRLTPNAVEAGASRLAADRTLAFAAGYCRFIASDGMPLPTGQPVRPGGDAYLALLQRNSIRMPAMVMFRRSALVEAGGFDSRWDGCADYDLYLRISRRFAVAFHTEVVAEYRRHRENMSLDAGLMLSQLLRAMRAQRQYLGANRGRRAAYRAGYRRIRAFYSDRLVDQIRYGIRRRGTQRQVVRDIVTLLRCHPVGAMQHLVRKVSNSIRSVRSRVRRRRSDAQGTAVS
jgi:glycosyltransferase involved in cell wall biosynthesis